MKIDTRDTMDIDNDIEDFLVNITEVETMGLLTNEQWVIFTKLFIFSVQKLNLNWKQLHGLYRTLSCAIFKENNKYLRHFYNFLTLPDID